MRRHIHILLSLILPLTTLHANQQPALPPSHAPAEYAYTADTDSIVPVLLDAQDKLQDAYETQLYILYGVIAILGMLVVVLGVSQYREQKRAKARQRQEEDATDTQALSVAQPAVSSPTPEERFVDKTACINGVLGIILQYIERITEYQKLIHRKIKAGRANDLLYEPFFDRAKDETVLYQRFDEIFLRLFPHFIDQLNEQLKPSEQFVHKEGEPLSTELRIVALVRLGMTDSAQIALFLQYSPRTIYNYRSLFRKKTLNEDMDMEHAVHSIC